MDHSDYDLIIFDCDGVLIDSELISAQTLIGLTQPLGIDIDLAYVQQHFLGRSFPTVAATISRQFNIDLPADFYPSYRKNSWKSSRRNCNQRMELTLSWLNSRSRFVWRAAAVLSASIARYQSRA